MAEADLATLLGFDPEQLQAALAALGPTPQMRDQANSDKWLATGLGILGARTGSGLGGVSNAVGQGGLLGMQAGRESLQAQLAQRGADLQQLMQLRQAAMQARMQNMGLSMLNGDQGDAPPQQQGGQLAPGTPLTGGEMGASSSASGLPVSSIGGVPLSGPTPSPSSPSAQSPGAGAPPWANARAQLGLALAGMNKAADVVGQQMKLEVSQGGIITRNGVMVGQMTPNGPLIYENGDPSKPRFYSNPQAVNEAAAKAAAAVAGAQTGATESAKAPFDLVEVKMSDGTTRTMPRSQALQLAQQQRGYAVPGMPAGTSTNFTRPLTPQEQTAVQQDAAASIQAQPQGNAPAGPVPFQSSTLYDQKMQEHGANEVQQMMASAQAASQTKEFVQDLVGLESKGIFSGGIQGTPFFLKTANVLAPFLPEAAYQKLSNTQAWTADTGNLIAQAVKQFVGSGGRVAAREIDFFRGVKPETLQTPEGRAQIYANIWRMADKLQQAPGLAQDYINSTHDYGLTKFRPQFQEPTLPSYFSALPSAPKSPGAPAAPTARYRYVNGQLVPQ